MEEKDTKENFNPFIELFGDFINEDSDKNLNKIIDEVLKEKLDASKNKHR